MKYEPFKDNVFLKIEEHNRETSGGIILPDTTDNSEYGDKIKSATVLKAGPGGFDDQGRYWCVDVTQGDRVLVACDAGQDVVVGEHIKTDSAPEFTPGTELRVIRNEEIIAIL